MSRIPEAAPRALAPTEPPIKEVMARGIAWMTAARLGVHALGLLSTMILARLLVPADFGLIAMAMSVVALLDTLGNFGFEMPLIQKQDATRDDFDTAWTLNILVAGAIATLIAVLAPFAADFYAEPRIEAILYTISAAYLILAFQNIGTIEFRKQLDFRRDFALQIAQKVAALSVSIPLAFALRSYWALVAGMVAGNVASVAVSYLFLRYRPRFCLRSSRQLLYFSKWLQITGLLVYVRDRGYILAMGRMLDTPSVGLFTLANEIASLPSTVLVQPLNRAVFPGFARITNDAGLLRDGYKSMLGLIAVIAVPAAFGVAALATLIVPVALGDKWDAAVPLLGLLALSGATRSLTASTISVHYAIGRPRQQTLTVGIQAWTLLPAVAVGVLAGGVVGAAWAYLLHSALVFVPVCFVILLRTTPIRWSDIWEPVWRPLLSAALMYAVVMPIARSFEATSFLAGLSALLLMASFGVIVYTTCLLVLWISFGRPPGAETALLRRFLPRLHAVVGRPRK